MLEGRILKRDSVDYAIGGWDGENRCGFDPLDDKTLVLVDEPMEMTAGGVLLPGASRERLIAAVEHGTVVAIGPAAFRWDDHGNRAWVGRIPQPGDRIYFERYAGQLVHGEDGRTYRLMSQRCIGAVAATGKEAREDVGDPTAGA